MARKSGGEIPAVGQIADANQAIALLEGMHHWNCTRLNCGLRRAYSLTVTHAGRRVTAQRRLFVDAVIAALSKLREPTKKVKMVEYMRIAK
jgi:hypothetical protein